MKERPITFSGLMVRAILDGTKTQTRRVLKDGFWNWWQVNDPVCLSRMRCPYGVPGDRLWVREAFSRDILCDGKHGIAYRADGDDQINREEGEYWRSAVHMPRWASRITVEITDVRAQRINQISAQDAIAEGISPIPRSAGPNFFSHRTDLGWYCAPTAQECFWHLWDSINAKRGYGCAANPWVWALTFRRLT